MYPAQSSWSYSQIRRPACTGAGLLASASIRLRPILLTSLTTVAALIPAAIGTTAGSRIFQPFAITVIGGLVSAVLGTLIVVPTLTAALPPSPDAWSKPDQVSG